ncbi:malonyl-CoA O-methyltransferase [Halospina denitrificans]|uniref:Malonyl-[acyl-carrier protein] O-methyltransferase n=1 Tax=Halospina denitrificans TaxID=332522 RepID=A0A4R7K1E2_9GAMM|nr:malonyl-ACP O-methyltransferase BioC [Halospina denitrificans]TDT43279.1 malonyl-CoA O-methyltransferase [Halospina denitrificans]
MSTEGVNRVSRERISDDFGAAASHYDSAARLQQQVGARLIERMDSGSGGQGMDLGCGTGYFLPMLSECLDPTEIVAADLSPGMIQYARQERGIASDWLVADAEALPLPDASLDWIFSSLMIQWCGDTAAVAREACRVLKPGGEAVFSTLVSGTLSELESAWAEADPGGRHVNRFLTVEELRAELGKACRQFSVEVEPMVLWYPDVMALLKELKTLGARYKDENRRRAAMAPARLRALRAAYERFRQGDQGVPATWQVAYVRLVREE